MGSHILDILRQGIWASITGGWFYDPHLSLFCNTFHMYIWLSLLAFPFILHMTVSASLFSWGIYCGIVCVFFVVVKLFNYKLHHMFDTSEVVDEEEDKGGGKKTGDTSESDSKTIEVGTENGIQSIEMISLARPVTVSAQTSPIIDGINKEPGIAEVEKTLASTAVEHRQDTTKSERKYTDTDMIRPAPLAELEIDDLIGAVGGSDISLLVKPIPMDQEDEEDTQSDTEDNPNLPNSITTKADVEKEPSRYGLGHPDLGEELANSPTASKCSCDADSSDVSPEHIIQQKQKKKPRRSKSALESTPSCKSYSEISLLPRPSLPTRYKMDSIIDKDKGVKIVRPQSEQVISSTRTSNTKLECSIDEEEKIEKPVGVVRPRLMTPPTNFMEEIKPKYVTSGGVSVDMPSKKVEVHVERQVLSHSNTNSVSSQPEFESVSLRSSTSDVSVFSLGEVFIDDEIKVETPKSKLEKIRPSSADTARSKAVLQDKDKSEKLGSLPVLTYKPESTQSSSKPKDLPLMRVSRFFKKSNDMMSSSSHSQQSSTVGLDWLFCMTDSDSSDTNSIEGQYSITSSTLTNDDSTTIDTSPEHIMRYYKLPDSENITSASSPSTDELEEMKKQGAIPKHFNRPLPPLPESSAPKDEDTKASSPSSFDLSDPEDIHRKLVEILSQPGGETSEQLKKFLAAMEAKTKDRKKPMGSGTAEDGMEDLDARSSKSTTPTEVSSLLPSTVDTRPQRIHRLSRRRARKRLRHSHRQIMATPPSLRPIPSQPVGQMHVAVSHDDTSDGATHWFQDEKGNWFSYTFGENSAGTALAIGETDENRSWKEDRWSSSSCESGSMVVLGSVKSDEEKEHPSLRFLVNRDLDLPVSVDRSHGILPSYVQQLLDNGRRLETPTDSDNFDESLKGNAEKSKHFYKFSLISKKFLKIYFDRLALLALLDRNLSVIENIVAVIIAVMVAALGAMVLTNNFYYDFSIFVFCFVLAGCQYSLLKSVQPDAASPMHGYNHLIVFSRPFYFCLCCGIMLFLDYSSNVWQPHTVYVYGMPFTSIKALEFARDLLKVFILCFPILFTIGLLPQVNTYIMYILEQLDMHVFGGNGQWTIKHVIC